MSDLVTVPFGDKSDETAVLLLDAAGKKGYDPSVVAVSSDHPDGLVFQVPADVAKAAGLDPHADVDLDKQLKADEKAQAELDKVRSDVPANTTDDSHQEEPAKKAAAKKAPARKRTAKKTAKKTTAKKTAAKKTAK